MKKIFCLLAVSSILFTSCATIFTGTKDRLTFESTPSGAKVYIDGIQVCKTPCHLDVKRNISDKMVEFKLDGYETRVVTLDKEFNAVTILNVFNGLIGFAIDLGTGSIMKYGRKVYQIELDKNKVAVAPEKIEINTKDKTATLYVASN